MTDRWPNVRLGEVLTLSPEPHNVLADAEYPNVGMYSYARGLFPKRPIAGSATSAKVLFRVKKDQFIYSRLFAFEGAYGVVPAEFDGAFVSNEYPTFDVDRSRLLPQFLELYFKQPIVWDAVAKASTGVGHRRQRVPPSGVFSTTIPLPPLSIQKHVVSCVQAIAGKVDEATRLRGEADADMQTVLSQAFRRIAGDAPRRPMSQVAPLIRRPIEIVAEGSYPELGIRSFGKGTFHKPALSGMEVGTKRLFGIEPGDLLFSNVFAWEGAIAVARAEDVGRYGSHRFITCLPRPEVATSEFLRFFFLTDEGLRLVGAASPGGAGRNRTLGLQALEKIEAPVPPIEEQLWFGRLLNKASAQTNERREGAIALDALVPAVLDKAFRGEM